MSDCSSRQPFVRFASVLMDAGHEFKHSVVVRAVNNSSHTYQAAADEGFTSTKQVAKEGVTVTHSEELVEVLERAPNITKVNLLVLNI